MGSWIKRYGREDLLPKRIQAETMEKGDKLKAACQYCCHAYIDELNSHGMGISMTEMLYCYENALTERVNGILKQEYSLGCAFKSKVAAKKAIDEAIWLFNTKPPHTALGYTTPAAAHSQPAAA